MATRDQLLIRNFVVVNSVAFVSGMIFEALSYWAGRRTYRGTDEIILNALHRGLVFFNINVFIMSPFHLAAYYTKVGIYS